MRVLRLWMCAAAVAPFALAQIPSFEASRVLPSGGSQPIPLAPGLLMSIYGSHLGPPSGCQGAGDTQHRETPSPLRPNQAFVETLIYPKELCGVRVLVGNMPAGLLYVQEQQINFKVPQETAVTGTTQLRVIYNGQSSASVTLPLGLQTVTLALEQPATVDMPVWLHVAIPYGEGAIRYPYGLWPAYFACVDIEVRRNGKLLPHMATLSSQAFNGVFMSGPPCGSAAPDDPRYRDRLPLHLQYRFAEPGSYEVRYTERSPFVQNRVLQSAWTRIEILPSSPGARARWLAAKRAPANSADLLTDYLPSVLGIPDEQSLRIVREYLWHSDSFVRSYAMYGLTYWPRKRAAASLLERLRTAGPSDAAIRFVARAAPGSIEPDALLKLSLPYLASGTLLQLQGALAGIRCCDKDTRVDAALVQSADHVITLGDAQTLNNYAAALGAANDPRARETLWRLVHANIAADQAAIALTWHHDPADLPALAELTLAPASNPLSYRWINLPYALHRGYGDAAIPYLETMLARSQFIWVRTDAARELAIAGRAAGFAFIAQAIEHNERYKGEMLQFIRDSFPGMRNADERAVLRYVKERATAVTSSAGK